MKNLSVINKIRFLRLFEGMMFWYGIEQLFMDDILRDPSARAWTTTAFTLSILSFDVISGAFADRFGRKKAMLVGITLQIIALALMGLSSSLLVFVIGAFVYGVYWGFMNGAVQAYLYDYLKNLGREQEYSKQLGAIWAYSFIGAGIANVVSGFLADAINLRAPFLLSLIPAIAAGSLVLSLSEPSRAYIRTHSLRGHADVVWQNLRRPEVVLYGLRRMVGSIIFLSVLEFGQLYLLSYGFSAKALGILWALTAAVCAIALAFSGRIQPHHEKFALFYALALVGFALILGPIGIALFFVIYAFNELLSTTTDTEIQHSTTSSVRATVLSVISFIGYAIGTVFTWLVNHEYTMNGIRSATSKASLAFAVLLVLSVLAVWLQRRLAHARLT